MKKLFLVCIVASISMISFAQFKLGGGITLGNQTSINQSIGAGLNIRGDYSFNKISISPGFTYIFPGTDGYNRYSAWQINADAHYHFYNADKIKLYGLVGLNFTEEKMSYNEVYYYGNSGTKSNTSSSTATSGLNLGGGIQYKKYFGEVKYDSGFNQLGVTFGVYF